MSQQYPHGVSIIPYREGCFAVSQRIGKDGSLGLWQFPGGYVEPGEDDSWAAMRELHEETGLLVDIKRLHPLGNTEPIRGYKNELYIGFRFGLVIEKTEELKHREPHKHTPWVWMTLPRLRELEMLQRTKEFAELFVRRIAHPIWPPK